MIPFAAENTDSFLILIIALFSVIIGMSIIIILLIYYNQRRDSVFNRLNNKNQTSIDGMKERVDALALLISKIEVNLKEISVNKSEQDHFLSDLKLEMTRVADGVAGQDMMTKAIELARKGTEVNLIVSETGLSKSDAEALVKFHKK